MRQPLTFALVVAALAFALVGAGSAVATSGGPVVVDTTTDGQFVLAGGHIWIPDVVSAYFDPGAASGQPVSAATTTVLTGVDRLDGRGLTLPGAVAVMPDLAAAGSQVAVLWSDDQGIRSGLLGPRSDQLVAVAVPIQLVGQGVDAAIGADPGGRRAVLWSDAGGVHLQAIATGGAVDRTTALSPSLDGSAEMAVTSDDDGGWWAVWGADARFTTAHVAADGSVTSPVDLGAAALNRGVRTHPPVPSVDDAPTVVPDGQGGVFVGFRRRVVHASAGDVTTVLAAPATRLLVLAAGQGSTAVAQDVAGGDVVVRRLGAHLGRAIRVHGPLIDVAVDHAHGTIEVLTQRARGHVALTAISATDHISGTRDLAFCHHRPAGQVLAADGHVAVSCGSPHVFSATSHPTVYRVLAAG